MKAKKFFLLLIAFLVISLVGCKNPIDSKDTEPIEMLTSAPMLSAFDVSEALGEKIIDTQYNHDLDEGTVLLKNKIKYTYKREYSVDEFCYTEVLEFEKLNNDTIRKYFNRYSSLAGSDVLYEDYLGNDSYEKKYQISDNLYQIMNIHTTENEHKIITIKSIYHE